MPDATLTSSWRTRIWPAVWRYGLAVAWWLGLSRRALAAGLGPAAGADPDRLDHEAERVLKSAAGRAPGGDDPRPGQHLAGSGVAS